MQDKATESLDVACLATREEIDAAKAEFLSDPGWESVYDNAPPGAKLRLEVSFWFSQNHKSWTDEQKDEKFTAYRTWRDDVEQRMSEKDLEYMVSALDKSAAKEHYAALLKDRKAGMRTPCGVKLMSYDDFFAMLAEQGEFKSYAYDDATKKSIISDFLPVLEGSGDPLEAHVEDILATAILKDARVYPKNEIMYVRVEVRFLTETAEWSRPYQMLVAWDCFKNLMGYAFPVGKGRRSELPYELENPPSKAQREKRTQLMAGRLSA